MVLSVSQFADMSGIAAHTIRKLDFSDKLKPNHLTKGGHRRYDVSQVEQAKRYVKKMSILPDGISVIDESKHIEPFSAYLLGMLFADGNVCKSGQVQLELYDKQILEDVAYRLGACVHQRADRGSFRITVPRSKANEMVELGLCRRKSQGFVVPQMSSESFGHFLCGLFDGDGSVSKRGNSIVFRLHGHPKSMGYIQATLLDKFGLYLAWVRDTRSETGMLETSASKKIQMLIKIIYSDWSICLMRKRKVLCGL